MNIRAGAEGVLVPVLVRPRSRPGLRVKSGQLTISVAAPAIEGRATEEARRALAGVLGVPAGSVSLRLGARSRFKVFVVTGLAPEEATRRLGAVPQA
jgi:uncharacterized protein